VVLDTLPEGVVAAHSQVLITTKLGGSRSRRQTKRDNLERRRVVPTCSLELHSLLATPNLDLSVLPRDPTREFAPSLVPSRSAFVIPALSLVKRLPRAQTPPNIVISTSEPILWRMVLTQTETRDGLPLVTVIEFHILMSSGGVRCACSGQLRSTGVLVVAVNKSFKCPWSQINKMDRQTRSSFHNVSN
jgi:hypothetical protein